MNIRTTLIASSLIAASLVSGAAHAVLQGRDLNGSAGSFEAYYDTVLDITWLANANMNGGMDWAAANTWAAQLNINGYDNWRLPTVEPVNGSTFNYSYSTNGSTDVGYNITSPQNEMAHLFYVTLGNPGYVTPDGAVSGCGSSANTCLDNVGPFTNLQADSYWSATEYAPGSTSAWRFSMLNGGQRASVTGNGLYALAVSPGDVAAVSEAQTYALMLAGLGLIGWRARRRG
ncbi:MAG: DUF1566 domain-containing protein [Sulfuriferula multivorans]|uniref:DUF1566 domain-containing protein n=1 Tax=Sulfuriferula multivorans TaxID=1559896 RepID=A0A7C9KY61_9PROT|nr:DUF1566 domain-containing protein [Sulfuriferula multivorans]